MPYTPEHNGVDERRNHTLMDLIRSMMGRSNLPSFSWGEALRTALHILNRVPSKFVPKIPFEMWIGRKPSLNHLSVWGCHAEVKIHDPTVSKIDSKTTRYFFIGYPDRSKEYRFYCSSRGRTVIDSANANFLKFDGFDVVMLCLPRR